jgi:cysteinyl-tRNA synthetase
MSMKYLGPTFDIHTGGVDLIFPHHENEIAQSEAATGQRFVNTWLHCAHLQLGGQKMARREGNIYQPAELYEQGWRPAELRYALLATYYRAPLEWTDDTMSNARAAVERLTTAVIRAGEYEATGGADDEVFEGAISAAGVAFRAGLDDDLNVSAALAAVFELVRELNRRMDARSISTAAAQRAVDALHGFDQVLAVIDEQPAELPDGAQALLDQRAAARSAREWSTSDRLRDELAAMGVAVEDTPAGQRWRRIAEVEHA